MRGCIGKGPIETSNGSPCGRNDYDIGHALVLSMAGHGRRRRDPIAAFPMPVTVPTQGARVRTKNGQARRCASSLPGKGCSTGIPNR
jgi:hypothetical protein